MALRKHCGGTPLDNLASTLKEMRPPSEWKSTTKIFNCPWITLWSNKFEFTNLKTSTRSPHQGKHLDNINKDK